MTSNITEEMSFSQVNTSLVDINKLATDVIAKVIISCGEKVTVSILEHFKDSKIRNSIDVKKAFEIYLINAFRKYSRTKTILFKRKPQYLYNYYECVGVKLGNDTIDTLNVKNIFEHGKFALITGTGGTGKTTMLKHFFLNALETKEFIPIFVELRNLNDLDMTFRECIYHNLKILGFSTGYQGFKMEHFEYSLATGKYLFLLDGFDEINSSKRKKLSFEIQCFCDEFSDNHFILTSRPNQAFVGWQRFNEFETLELSKIQALSLIKKINESSPSVKKFIDLLDSELFEKFNSFAKQPLLLIILYLTFESNASIPDQLHNFYAHAFQTLFNEHDATKDGFHRTIESGLSYDTFKDIFAYFCFLSFFKSDFEFDYIKLYNYFNMCKNEYEIDFDNNSFDLDLQHGVCMLIQEGFTYHFSHRSFQEYFAALYVSTLIDQEQTNIVTPWILDGNDDFNNGFLKILYGMSPKRFKNNIIIPLLKHIRRLYNNNNKSREWLISYLITEITLIKSNSAKINHILCFNSYSACYINLFNYLDSISYSKSKRYLINDAYAKTKINEFYTQLLIKENSDILIVDISEILDSNYREFFIDCNSDLIMRFDYAIKYLSDYENEQKKFKTKNVLIG